MLTKPLIWEMERVTKIIRGLMEYPSGGGESECFHSNLHPVSQKYEVNFV